MSNYIDYETVHEDFQNLHEYITEELEVESYREVMLLLRYAERNLQPKQQEQTASDEPEKIDYVG